LEAEAQRECPESGAYRNRVYFLGAATAEFELLALIAGAGSAMEEPMFAFVTGDGDNKGC
jgi:hypothetical protein